MTPRAGPYLTTRGQSCLFLAGVPTAVARSASLAASVAENATSFVAIVSQIRPVKDPQLGRCLGVVWYGARLSKAKPAAAEHGCFSRARGSPHVTGQTTRRSYPGARRRSSLANRLPATAKSASAAGKVENVALFSSLILVWWFADMMMREQSARAAICGVSTTAVNIFGCP